MYRIHLGSGNILMEPNDRYLCIVPARGAASASTGKVFLPFEGDGTLAVILSKALLLAEDKSIKIPRSCARSAREANDPIDPALQMMAEDGLARAHYG